MYKPLVRVVKNIKRKLVEEHGMNSDLAPSYFVECMIYNVPDDNFSDDIEYALECPLRYALEKLLDFILGKDGLKKCRTVSHQQPLFGEGQWNEDDAMTFFQWVKEVYYSN